MARRVLVIGNKNYSSWSLRPWLALRMGGVEFEEVRIPLYREDSKAAILRYSPSGKVPIWIEDGVTVWESLAICERAAERAPGAGLWPADPAARAHARAISAEMHAGFSALRNAMPMNLRAAGARIAVGPEVRADVERIVAIWEDCRARFGAGGPFLFGAFTNADAMYAPVVTRFHSYGVSLPLAAQVYADAVRALPAMQEWAAAGVAEAERIEETDRVARGA
ncbi:MAG TPA: glutathione S-transferase family protein [Myxococcota bacterium]|nr:glutathione S-transferase family protein [Myxococcota bacterium]